MATQPFGRHSEIHNKRLDWLRKHKRLWNAYSAQLPGSFQIEKMLLDKMIAAGLYPKKTTILDVSLERLIHKIRMTGRPKKVVKTYED